MPMLSMLRLRPARSEECAALSELCIRSKAVWGYDEAFISACRAELTLTAATLAQADVLVAEIDGRIIGVVEMRMSGSTALLEKLFIDPAEMRCGAGRRLFDWARETAVTRGAARITVESDPQAAHFYRCMGAIDDGKIASTSIFGRFIPKLTLQLQKTN